MEPLQRQYLGCGYLPPLDDRKRLTMWQPPQSAKGYRGPAPTICAGYTTRLPEVVEVMRGRTHWGKGSLRDFAHGQPDDQLLMMIEILDGQYHAMQTWLMTPASEGGGRD